jgi:hypothetical protein
MHEDPLQKERRRILHQPNRNHCIKISIGIFKAFCPSYFKMHFAFYAQCDVPVDVHPGTVRSPVHQYPAHLPYDVLIRWCTGKVPYSNNATHNRNRLIRRV